VLQETQDREQIIARVAALDIGKAEVVCCVRVPHESRPGRRLQEVDTYSTMTRSLLGMADRLHSLGVTRVVMEATSDYWKPVFWVLEAAGFETWLVNARDVKHLPGRPKTDKLDAVWLCKVAERQMIRPSFVPPPQIRRLRDVTRYRADLVGARTAEKNRAEKLLEDAQIKISVVASDLFGVSGRAMMAALIAGERSPAALAQLARTRLRTRIPALQEAFTGHFTDHHAFLLDKMLARVDGINTDIAELDARIEEMIAPFAQAAARLDEIPGIGPVAAAIIIAEIGTDMTRFPTAGHLASWAKFSPGVKAAAPPGTATSISPASWARPSSERPGPTPSSGSATGGSPAAAAPRKPSSPPAAPSSSSSGTCCLTPTPATPTSAATSTTSALTPSGASAPTSTSSKPSATRSPSNPPPDQHLHPSPAPLALCRALPHAR
jgi:transposase